MKLNHETVSRLQLPQGKADVIFFDSDIPGLGIRIQRGKSRHWIFQYKVGSKKTGALQRRMSLGKFPAVGTAAARKTAAEYYARVKLGQDPQGEKQASRARATETFAAIAKRYLTEQRDRLRPRSFTETERYLTQHALPLHGLSFAKIDQRTIAARLGEVRQASGPSAANRFRAILSALYSWAMSEALTDSNPVSAIKKNDEVSRDRVLSDKELRSIWRALPAYGDYAAIVKLLILTGQRRKEISDLRWSEIDLERGLIRLPAQRTKNGRAHIVPLSQTARSLLSSQPQREGRDFVFGEANGGFAGHSRCKTRLDAASGITGWTLHDLRRSAATGMAEIGIAPHVIEAILNHVSGHKQGVAGIYNRASYAAEKATGLARWAEHVAGIVEKRKSNVSPLVRA